MWQNSALLMFFATVAYRIGAALMRSLIQLMR